MYPEGASWHVGSRGPNWLRCLEAEGTLSRGVLDKDRTSVWDYYQDSDGLR
jgi:hypothetical protein